MGGKIDIGRHEITEHLRFETEYEDGRKTPIVRIFNRSNGCHLGQIRWYGAWRKFCFYPAYQTIFDSKCLSAIFLRLDGMMAERKKKP